MKRKVLTWISLMMLLAIISCKESPTDPPIAALKTPQGLMVSEVTSDASVVSWVGSAEADYYLVDVALNENFTEFTPGMQGMKTSHNSLNLVDLLETTSYFVRVQAVRGEEKTEYTGTVEFQTWLLTQSFIIKALDGVELHGSSRFPEGDGPFPTIIFCHSAGSDETEWFDLSFFGELHKLGYGLITFDNRNHGQSGAHPGTESDPQAYIGALLTDPEGIPVDIRSIVNYAKVELREADNNNIGIIGSSMGGNLALVAIGHDALDITTAVSLSPRTDAVRDLSYGINDFMLKNTFYIASEDDQDGARKMWAEELNSATSGEKKIRIISGNAHGSTIISESVEVKDEIIQWLEVMFSLR